MPRSDKFEFFGLTVGHSKNQGVRRGVARLGMALTGAMVLEVSANISVEVFPTGKSGLGAFTCVPRRSSAYPKSPAQREPERIKPNREHFSNWPAVRESLTRTDPRTRVCHAPLKIGLSEATKAEMFWHTTPFEGKS